MFADDTKIFRVISSYDDAVEVQEGISRLEKWVDKCQLLFIYDKCHILTLGKSKNIQHANRYEMSGNDLEHVFEEKNLGIAIDADLNFGEHIPRKVRFANEIVVKIRRSFSCLDCDTFSPGYGASLRPHLEYGKQLGQHILPETKMHLETFRSKQQS